MPYDADGEPIRPEDVLGDDELAELSRDRRHQRRRVRVPKSAGWFGLYADDPFYDGTAHNHHAPEDR